MIIIEHYVDEANNVHMRFHPFPWDGDVEEGIYTFCTLADIPADVCIAVTANLYVEDCYGHVLKYLKDTSPSK